MRRSGILMMLLLASCGGSNPTTNPPLRSASATVLPGAIGNTKAGHARLELSGGYTVTLEMPLDNARSQLHPAPGGFALFWSSSKDTLVSMGGVVFNGTRKTQAGLAVGFLWRKGSSLVQTTSSKGECTITMRSTSTSVGGSFVCAKLTANGKNYAAKGTYSASA